MPVAGLLSGRFGSVGRRWRGGSHAVLPADQLPPHVAIAAVALSIAATAVPLALILEPELRGQVAPPRFANLLLGLLLSVPAGVGLAAAFSGLRRLSRFDNGAGWIYEAAVLRILVAAMLFSHAAVIGVLSGPSSAGSRMLLTAEAGLVVGWLVLLTLLMRLTASIWRRRCAAVLDAAILALFLHFGGQDAAGWYPVYLLLIVDGGVRIVFVDLDGNAALAVLGFGAVAAPTACWQQQPALTAECGIALLLLPVLGQGPVRAIAEARASAATAEHGKSRFVAVLAEILRGTLFGRAQGTRADPREAQFRGLLPQLANILDLAAIEAGTYAPRTEPFDIHELVNDAVLAARATAESRAVELMGGRLTVEAIPSANTRLTVQLTFAIDKAAAEPPLQSAGCPVLIVTGDSVFAGNVCDYLSAWDAPVSWIGESDAALNYITWLDQAVRAVLVVDGRTRPLAAVSFVERASALDGTPPFTLFVAEPGQLAALADLEDGEVAAFLPALLNPQLLANALHALPLRADAAARRERLPENT